MEGSKIFTSRIWTPPEDTPPPGRFDDDVNLYNVQDDKIKTETKRGIPEIISAAELKEMTFPPVRYVVNGYIAEGCSLLAGAPKLGKSWLMYEIAVAKATGGTCLGSIQAPEAEDVLYLALEDNLRRLR